MMRPSGSNGADPGRRRAEREGRRAEGLAALYLSIIFYRVVARRWKTPQGEIDIVAKKGRMLVFVEVKRRRMAAGEEGALRAVNPERLAAAARWWLARHPEDAGLDIRFDVIFLAPGRWPRHLRGAFLVS